MAAQDVIRFLFLLYLQNRDPKQVMQAHSAPTSARALLSKQLYNKSRSSDSPPVPSPFVGS